MKASEKTIKELKESLQEEKFWAEIVRNASVGIAVGSPDGCLIRCNAAFSRITGYTPDEMKNIKWNEALTPPEWLDLEMEKRQELHEIKKPVVYEKEYIQKNGERIPIELTVNPGLGEQGEILYYYLFVSDISERKTKENDLKDSRVGYKGLVEEIADLIIELDTNGIINYVSPNAKELLVYDVKDIVGQRFEEIVYPEDLDIALEAYEKHKKGHADPIEFRMLTKKGDVKWISILSKYIPGKKIFRGVIRDITTNKEAEEKLQAANQQLLATEQQLRAANQQLKDNEIDLQAKNQLLRDTGRMAGVGGWELDVASKMVTWSEETYKIHEVSMDHQPRVDEAIDFFHPDDRPVLQKALTDAAENGEAYDLVLRFISAKGKHLITRTICRPEMKDGRVVKLKGTFQDVTNWKKSEEKLQSVNEQLIDREHQLRAAKEQAEKNEEYYHSILDNIGDPVFIKDDQSRLQFVNDAFCRLFDLQRSKIIGKTLAEDVAPEEREIFLRIDKEVIRSGKENINEEAITIRGGQTRTISTKKSRLINKGKKILVGIVRDITERKNAEKEIQATNQQLMAANQQLSASEQQLRAGNQQLAASEQQLRVANQQLTATEQQLRAANQQLAASEAELKKTLESLEEKNKRFEEAQVMGKIANYEFDIVNQTYRVSDEAKRIYGYSLDIEDFSFDDVWKCIPDKERLQQAWADLIEKDKPYNLEHEIRPVSGPASKIIKAIAEVVKDKTGKPIKVVGLIQDITERKNAEKEIQATNQQLMAANQQLNASEQQLKAANQQLAASEAELKKTLESLAEKNRRFEEAQEMGKIANYEFDIAEQTYRTSDEGKRIYGFSLDVEEFSFEDIWKCTRDKERLQQAWADVVEKDKVFNGEFEINPVSGPTSKFIKSVAKVVKDKSGNPIKVVGLIQDITKRKKAEEELRRQEILLRSSIESFVDMIILSLDTDYRYLYFNSVHGKVMKAAYGQEPDLGACIFNYMTNEEDINRIKYYYDKGLKGQSSVSTAIYGEKDKKYYEIHVNPILDEKKRVIGITSFSYDITEKMKSEEALKAVNYELENTELLAQVGGWSIDMQTMNIHLSKGVREIYQIAPDRILPIEEGIKFYAPEHQSKIEKAVQECMQTGKPYDLELKLITAKGDNRWVRTGGSAEMENNKIIKLSGFLQDITSRKLAAIALRENQKRLETIFDTIEDMIIEVKDENEAFFINTVNNSFLKNSGLSRSAILNQKVDTVLDNCKSIDSYIKRAIREQKTINFDCQLVLSGVTRYWEFYASPIFDVENRLSRIVINIRDLTERISKEIAIKNSQEKFRFLCNLASDAVFEYDIKSNQIDWYDEFFSLFGYTKDEIEYTADWINSKIHLSDRKRLKESLEAAYKQKAKTWSGESRMQCKNGEYKDVITKAHLYYSKDGKPIKALGVIVDYSNKQKAEELRISALVEGADNERKVIARELHDNLGQNLTFVSMLLEQLKAGYEFQIVQRASQLLSKTIEETRNLSHLLMPKVVHDYGLKAAILSQIETLQMSKKYDLTTHFNFDGDRLETKIENNIYSILQEIITNIIKHAKARSIQIQLIKSDDSISLSVEDDGVGFDRDWVLANGGLGLKNIENRVYLLKGSLIIESAPNRGAFINIEVPLI